MSDRSKLKRILTILFQSQKSQRTGKIKLYYLGMCTHVIAWKLKAKNELNESQKMVLALRGKMEVFGY